MGGDVLLGVITSTDAGAVSVKDKGVFFGDRGAITHSKCAVGRQTDSNTKKHCFSFTETILIKV